MAANRDHFDPDVFKSKLLLKFGRLQAKKGEKPSATTLYLRIEPAYENGAPGIVVIQRSAFTKADKFAANKKEADNQGLESLRAVLEREAPEVARRLGFGKHPSGGAIDADAFAVKRRPWWKSPSARHGRRAPGPTVNCRMRARWKILPGSRVSCPGRDR